MIKREKLSRVNSDQKFAEMVKGDDNPFRKIKKEIAEKKQQLNEIQEEDKESPQEFIQVLHTSPSFKMTIPLSEPKVPQASGKLAHISHEVNHKQDEDLIKNSIRDILGIVESQRQVEQKEEGEPKQRKAQEEKKVQSKKQSNKKPKTQEEPTKPKTKKELLKEFYNEMKKEIEEKKRNKMIQGVQSQKKLIHKGQSNQINSSRQLTEKQASKPTIETLEEEKPRESQRMEVITEELQEEKHEEK